MLRGGDLKEGFCISSFGGGGLIHGGAYFQNNLTAFGINIVLCRKNCM